MATKNPRIAAYPPPKVYELLVEFKRSQGLKSDSAAIVAILETYLCGSIPNVLPSELSSTPKRIEDLEVKVSSLLSDVAVLKQAMSQYTCQGSGEDLSHNECLHQPDNYEALSEPPNESPNIILDLTNEAVVTSESISRSELQITGADVDTELLKSSITETLSANSELSNESLLVTPTAESILNYTLFEENTPPHNELLSELPSSDSLESVNSESLTDSLDGLPLSEENNHPKVSSGNSEPLNDLQDSSLEPDESKNSLQILSHLTGAALARRLNVSPSTLRHKKNAPNFGQWTSVHDPDGIAWHFDGEKFIEKPSPDIQ
ncbi:hypothetical protein NIES37_68090 [Tolypothrix tenuis PCC 7101]|uniref:Uncharacterized protein n=1 Tax=Tolypothrix tenuis PCC 7101 TaxID=231146 RepID=A0A1Z4NAT5_9CYAN|nr:hypothetical protein [Aulosira sp. FACHB-113]BAZ02796.1 hypothetical protein NIES37_68090 [Tolypothrix tenuis PCC 7101]BAZ78310.1 hypothetical protein NIES50_69430 [Aulosira laxa NIES-50]